VFYSCFKTSFVFSSSAYQEISRLVWNTKVHDRIHNSPPLEQILIKFS